MGKRIKNECKREHKRGGVARNKNTHPLNRWLRRSILWRVPTKSSWRSRNQLNEGYLKPSRVLEAPCDPLTIPPSRRPPIARTISRKPATRCPNHRPRLRRSSSSSSITHLDPPTLQEENHNSTSRLTRGGATVPGFPFQICDKPWLGRPTPPRLPCPVLDVTRPRGWHGDGRSPVRQKKREKNKCNS